MNRRSARNRHRRPRSSFGTETRVDVWHSPDHVERRTYYSLPPLPNATPVQSVSYCDGEIVAFTADGAFALSSGAWVIAPANHPIVRARYGDGAP